jgi:hypothetical protein
MISRAQVLMQSRQITSDLVRLSLCDAQNFPVLRELDDHIWQISIGDTAGYSIAMRHLPYREIYSSFSQQNLFNFRMIDGGLIQMLYEFRGNELLYHRLAFFPSPNLEEYQSAFEVYEADEIYADILMKEIVPFPIRFEFNRADEKHIIVHHPKSHLTLGQYKNCRIPVSGPLTPYLFMGFILRNFYNTAFKKYSDLLTPEGEVFQDSIEGEEVGIPHLRLPTLPRISLLRKLGFLG